MTKREQDSVARDRNRGGPLVAPYLKRMNGLQKQAMRLRGLASGARLNGLEKTHAATEADALIAEIETTLADFRSGNPDALTLSRVEDLLGSLDRLRLMLVSIKQKLIAAAM